MARITDPNLVNPWGQAASLTSPLWVADNGANVSTLYTGGVKGSIPNIVPLVVRIPKGAPTGIVFNPTAGFLVHTHKGNAPASFIFDSENGVVSAWSNAVSGTRAKAEFTSKRAVFKGLAIGSVGAKDFLYAANFTRRGSTCSTINSRRSSCPETSRTRRSRQVSRLRRAVASRQAIRVLRQAGQKHDDVAGPGNGFVDVYNTSGHLLRRLIAHGDLNSPWGLVIAPSRFGAFGGDLLVGNFGDGAIHAYSPATGAPNGQLTNTDGNPILINGLWALRFRNGTFGTQHTLVFTAGIGDEAHGLLGEITPAR